MKYREYRKEKTSKGIAALQRQIEELKRLKSESSIVDEAMLREGEAKLIRVLEAIYEGVTFSDENGHFYVYNLAMEKITGYSMKEANESSDFTALLYPNPEDRQRAFKGIAELLETGANREIEMIIRTKNGQSKYILVWSSLIWHKGRKMFLSVYRDITDHKKGNEELQKAYDKLKAAQLQLIQAEKMEAIGRMASGVAHEVKNPLETVLLGIDYLEDELSPAQKDVAEVLRKMRSNIARANNIVHALLDFSRPSKLQTKPEDINPILESSLDLIRCRVKLEGIKVVKKLGKGLPKVLVDASKMEQVFINIFLNATEAMPRGGKLFIYSYLTKMNRLKKNIGMIGGDYFIMGEKVVVVETEDEGVGISEKNIRRIFDPFFTTKGMGTGTGLGLSVTASIIDMHKGSLEIKSKEGRGTNVIIGLKISGE
jgi:PAS domain S-box-containing protein